MLFRLVRSDGAVIYGPYKVSGFAQGMPVVDIPVAGSWGYTLQYQIEDSDVVARRTALSDNTHFLMEARLIGVVVAR